MTSHDGVLLVVAAVLVLLAGLFAGAEAALSSYSKVRANEQVEQGNLRAVRLRDLLSDAPRYLNTLLLVRLSCEITAIVLVTQALSGRLRGHLGAHPDHRRGDGAGLVRDHRRRAAHAGPAALGPVRDHLGRSGDGADPDPRPAAEGADPDRQRAHPGQGVRRGPVRDRGRAARAGRPGREVVGDRVRRAADDPLGLRARRHHRPRGDGAADRHGLHRAAQEAAPAHLAGTASAATRGSR